MQAFGSGFAGVMFGSVEQIPYGWRSLYTLGLIALLFIAYWRQTQPETEHYQLIEKLRSLY